jgi:hypothetical protein
LSINPHALNPSRKATLSSTSEFRFNQPPTAFTTLEGQFESGAASVGAFGDSQSAPITGVTTGQNLAETALEAAVHPLPRALRLLYLSQNNPAAAEPWDMSLSDWTRMQEAALLNRAKALGDELTPQTQGVNPPGTPTASPPQRSRR